MYSSSFAVACQSAVWLTKPPSWASRCGSISPPLYT